MNIQSLSEVVWYVVDFFFFFLWKFTHQIGFRTGFYHIEMSVFSVFAILVHANGI